MSNNVLVTGASGYLGKKILLAMDDSSFLSPDRKELDICSPNSVRAYCEKNAFDTVHRNKLFFHEIGCYTEKGY